MLFKIVVFKNLIDSNQIINFILKNYSRRQKYLEKNIFITFFFHIAKMTNITVISDIRQLSKNYHMIISELSTFKFAIFVI